MIFHMGGELWIFPSPRAYMDVPAYMEGEFGIFPSLTTYTGSEFFQVLEPIWGEKLRIFLSPKADMGKSLESFQVPEPIWECQIQYIDIFLHIPPYFQHISSYFSHIPSYFPHIRSYLLYRGIPECDVIRGGGEGVLVNPEFTLGVQGWKFL